VNRLCATATALRGRKKNLDLQSQGGDAALASADDGPPPIKEAVESRLARPGKPLFPRPWSFNDLNLASGITPGLSASSTSQFELECMWAC